MREYRLTPTISGEVEARRTRFYAELLTPLGAPQRTKADIDRGAEGIESLRVQRNCIAHARPHFPVLGIPSGEDRAEHCAVPPSLNHGPRPL